MSILNRISFRPSDSLSTMRTDPDGYTIPMHPLRFKEVAPSGSVLRGRINRTVSQPPLLDPSRIKIETKRTSFPPQAAQSNTVPDGPPFPDLQPPKDGSDVKEYFRKLGANTAWKKKQEADLLLRDSSYQTQENKKLVEFQKSHRFAKFFGLKLPKSSNSLNAPNNNPLKTGEERPKKRIKNSSPSEIPPFFLPPANFSSLSAAPTFPPKENEKAASALHSLTFSPQPSMSEREKEASFVLESLEYLMNKSGRDTTGEVNGQFTESEKGKGQSSHSLGSAQQSQQE